MDERHGGFIGQLRHDGQVVEGAPKGSVLHTRILWGFAAAGRALEDDRCLSLAQRAYAYLVDHFRDEEHGGIYWMLDHAGTPLQTKKQVYAQAFAIYGLAEYYRATGEDAAIAWAKHLFNTVERYCYDGQHGGYFEAYSRAWSLLGDVRLSEKDANEKKSMNTHLHVLEAYTTFYQVWPDPVLRQQLRSLITLFTTTILDKDRRHLQLFFEEDWTVRSTILSFGHDIEASWLLTEAAEAVGDPTLIERTHTLALQMAQATLDEGVDDDGALLNEDDPGGHRDEDRHWWPQAEAVVGFLNAYHLSGKPAFLDAALSSWNYIDTYLIDRENGEWFFRVSKAGRPYASENKVGPWKGPYHNVRACLEVMARIDKMVKFQ